MTILLWLMVSVSYSIALPSNPIDVVSGKGKFFFNLKTGIGNGGDNDVF